ncbi:hypothetical protein BS78_06G116800 [Paspalum vaginatum]|nr:hypothetical protein BS78_06G116800 [Paspalum vaginatum]
MLKLAKILHSRGFHVTFVNSEFNHRRLLRSRGARALDGLPDFRFATIPEGLPPSDVDATQDVPSLCRATMENCLPHFRRLLAELNSSPDVPPVTCVFGDDVMSFTLEAAREIGVPCALFWTASVCGYLGYLCYRTIVEKGIFPFKDAEQLTNGFLDTPAADWATGMSKHIRLKDFPSFMRSTDPEEFMFHFALKVTEQMAGADAVILNTFDELEQDGLDAMRAMIPSSASIHTIGPLAFLAEEIVPRGGPIDALGSNLWKEDVSCFDWLHGREPRSVVYVNYGSITVMTNEELVEFAWGLANCGHDFLWVIRPDLVNGDAAVLPPEFTEAIKGRGHLATWCPQEVVLRHEAVGVFLTHSGWNSTMESLCAGPPGCPCCAGPSSRSSRPTAGTSAWSGAWPWRSDTTSGVRRWRRRYGRPWAGTRERRCTAARWSGGRPASARPGPAGAHTPTSTGWSTTYSSRVATRVFNRVCLLGMHVFD